ncbi:MAG: hypothetical protein ACI4J5_08440 [Oscillospiraceae bacterium]
MNFNKALSVAAAAAMAVSVVGVCAYAEPMTQDDIGASVFVMGNGAWSWYAVEVKTVDGVISADINAADLIAGSKKDNDAAIGQFGIQFSNPIGKAKSQYKDGETSKELASGTSYSISYTLKKADGTVIKEGTVKDSEFVANGVYGQCVNIEILANGTSWDELEALGNMKFEAKVAWDGPAAATEEEAPAAEAEAAPAAEAAVYDFTAKLGFADTSWSAQDWDTSAKVTGNGQFVIESTAVAGASDFGVFVVDIEGMYASNPEATVKLDKIEIDGAEVAFDASKIIYGDVEEKGNYRIEIYNQYGDSKSDPGVTSTAINSSLKLTFTVSGLPDTVAEAAPAAEETPVEVPAETVEEAPVETTVEEEIDEEISAEPISFEQDGISLIQVGGEGTSTAWGQAVVMYTYNNIEEDEEPGENPFDVSLLNENSCVVVYYESDVAPELILQSWSGGNGWAKVPQNEAESVPGMAVFTYDYMTAMYGTDDFSSVDAVNIGDQGADLTVYGVYVLSVTDEAAAEIEAALEEAEEDTADDTADTSTAAPAADTADTTAPKTGNAGLAGIAGVIAVAGAAAVTFKKRK